MTVIAIDCFAFKLGVGRSEIIQFVLICEFLLFYHVSASCFRLLFILVAFAWFIDCLLHQFICFCGDYLDFDACTKFDDLPLLEVVLYLCLESLLVKIFELRSLLDSKSWLTGWKWVASFSSEWYIVGKNVRIDFSEPVVDWSNVEKIVFDFAGARQYLGFKDVLVSPSVRVNDFFKLLKDWTNSLSVDELDRFVRKWIFFRFFALEFHYKVDINEKVWTGCLYTITKVFTG